MSFKIRSMQPDDLTAVIAIQASAYSGYFLESPDVIAQRSSFSSSTSWVAEQDGRVCAYLMGYWSKLGQVSPLNAPFTLVEGASCLYLHDLALSKSAQGLGLAKLLINAATEYAITQAAPAIGLVSVQDSMNFWRKSGFSEFAELSERQYENLCSYVAGDEPAFYMVKYL